MKSKKINQGELSEILEQHKLWLDTHGKEGTIASLIGASLSYANLSGTDLRHANLMGASLIGANLRNADLIGVNLRSADLRSADLENANLNWSNLTNTNLTNVKLNWCSTQDIEGKEVIAIQINTTRVNNLISYWKDLKIVTTGCFHGTLEELEKQVNITHKNNEKLRNKYLKAIKFMKEMSEEQ